MLKKVIIQIEKDELKYAKKDDIILDLNKICKDLKENSIECIELERNQDPSLIHQMKDKKMDEIHEWRTKEEQEWIKNKIESIVSLNKKEEYLIISDLCSVILTAHKLQIPCVGYDNPVIEKQDLYKSDMVVEGFEEVDSKFLIDVYRRFYQLPITVAFTERLIIREMVLEDLDKLYELYSNHAITRFLEPLYENRQEEMEFTRAYIKNMYGFYGYGMWVLLDKERGKLIGRAGLNNREVDGEVQIELGYMIGVPYQRKGYAFEACSAILKFAVEKLECFRVNCFIDSENKASLALVNKLGFEYVQETEIDKEKLSLYRWTYH